MRRALWIVFALGCGTRNAAQSGETDVSIALSESPSTTASALSPTGAIGFAVREDSIGDRYEGAETTRGTYSYVFRDNGEKRSLQTSSASRWILDVLEVTAGIAS